MGTEDQFQTFGKFEHKADALQLASLFKKNNIEYVTEDMELDFDPIFSSNKLNKEFRIKIYKKDFETADLLIAQSPDSIIRQIQKAENDYYLFGFTDEELMEIVSKRDEWSNHDFNLALSILKERGKEVSTEELESLKVSRLSQLSQPESHNKFWIYVGYLSALLGGFFGMLIGWYLMSAKKSLPDGTSICVYSRSGRTHGRFILILGLVIFITFAARAIVFNLNH